MESKNLEGGCRYECPVYYTLGSDIYRNADIITRIWLPIKENTTPQHWAKRAVNIVCHTED